MHLFYCSPTSSCPLGGLLYAAFFCLRCPSVSSPSLSLLHIYIYIYNFPFFMSSRLPAVTGRRACVYVNASGEWAAASCVQVVCSHRILSFFSLRAAASGVPGACERGERSVCVCRTGVTPTLFFSRPSTTTELCAYTRPAQWLIPKPKPTHSGKGGKQTSCSERAAHRSHYALFLCLVCCCLFVFSHLILLPPPSPP